MSSKQLITEISRIKEMMGITESKILLKENVVDEIVEFLSKFLRKDIGELTALGVRNVDDVKKLMDDFLDPAISSANKIDYLKYILDEVGDVAMKSIAKEAVDDVTTGVGKLVNDRMSAYIDAYKKGIVSYDEIINKVSDVLINLIAKTSEELENLKYWIRDKAKVRIKNQLDNIIVPGNVSGSADDALDQLIKNNDKAEKVLNRFNQHESWAKLSQRQRTLIENFVNANKDMDYITLIAKTDDELKKSLIEALKPNLAKKIWNKYKLLKGWKKWALGVLLMGTVYKTTGGTAICTVRYALQWLGEWFGAWDMEGQEAWNKCDWGYKPEEVEGVKKYNCVNGVCEEDPTGPYTESTCGGSCSKSNSNCPGESSFKTAIETAYGGAANVDSTKFGMFDTAKCAGTYDGSTYTWDNGTKDWI